MEANKGTPNNPAMQQHGQPRQEQYVTALAQYHPKLWAQIDAMRATHLATATKWPNHVFIPTEIAFQIITDNAPGYVPNQQNVVETLAFIEYIHDLQSLSAWRTTKGIYRFDPTLYDELLRTPIEGNLPCEAFRHMPEWCVYIETPGMIHVTGQPQHGFFAWIEYELDTQKESLVMKPDLGTETLSIGIPLGDWTLKDAFATLYQQNVQCGHTQRLHEQLPPKETDRQLLEKAEQYAKPLISLLTYLCTQNAEIGDGTATPQNPTPKKTKKGDRIFPPEKPHLWDIGIRIGAALRHAYAHNKNQPAEEGHHATPRPHIRVAHWYHFWTGSKNNSQPQKLIVKWLPPIPVNLTTPDNLPITVRAVHPNS